MFRQYILDLKEVKHANERIHNILNYIIMQLQQISVP